jgi:fatty-acyl-CoA synthase
MDATRLDPARVSARPFHTYVDLALHRLRNHEETVLWETDRRLTGRQLVDAVRRAAGALHAGGAGRGTVVAILTAPNHGDMVIARWAAHHLGASVMHLRSANPRTDEDQLPAGIQAEVLATAGAGVLVVDRASRDRGRRLAGLLPGLVLVDGLDGTPLDASPEPPSPDDCAVLDFTSGSSSTPRLVEHTFGTRERLLARLAADQGPSPSRFCSVTPISHTTSPLLDVAIMRGGCAVLHGEFVLDRVLEEIGRGMTDIYLAVPHLYALLDDPRTRTADLSRLRRVIYSGTPSAPERVAAAVGVFGPCLVQVYGSTETGGISALTDLDHLEPELHGTVGRPFPWVEVSLRHEETGAPVPDGGPGVVWVRSDTCMHGYRGDDDLSRRTLVDGWVDTGDIGRFDEYGALQLIGRRGGVIKCGGLKVYPESIERLLVTHPAVREAVVLGVRDHERREHVHAVLQVRPGTPVPEEELSALVAEHLTPTHVPERYLYWSGIPMTASGKPHRGRVRSLMGA